MKKGELPCHAQVGTYSSLLHLELLLLVLLLLWELFLELVVVVLLPRQAPLYWLATLHLGFPMQVQQMGVQL